MTKPRQSGRLDWLTDAAQKRRAFAAARQRMSEHSIPELIDLLASAELRTRFLAEMCLRAATNT